MGALRTDGPLRLGTTWTTHVAGAELNASVGLARLGHQVTWCSRVGDDDFGRLVVREARAEGVTLDVEVDPERHTGGLRVVRQAGTSSVSYTRRGSAASALDAATLTTSLERANADIALVCGITPALSPTCRDGWLAVVAAAAERATVVLDVNHRPTLWSSDDAAATLRQVVGRADVVVGDLDELRLLSDASSEDDVVADLMSQGVDLVAIKRGVNGASLVRAGQRHDLLAEPAVEVDPIGAGDAFTAGLVSAMLDGLDDGAALARAVAMGAWAVSTSGDWEGLPTRAQLLTGRGGVRR